MNNKTMTSKTNNIHRPSDDVLAAYAFGTLSEAPSLLVASHLTLSPGSRRAVNDFEAAGGVMLEEVEPVGLKDGALSAVLHRLDDPVGDMISDPIVCSPAKAVPANDKSTIIPQPLQAYLPTHDPENLPWRRLGPGVHQVRLNVDGGDVRLLRIERGRTMPEHGHSGMEWTLVLDGGFSDHMGQFIRGDVEQADSAIIHEPAADTDGDCLCLAVTDAPLRLKGFARLLQPIMGI